MGNHRWSGSIPCQLRCLGPATPSRLSSAWPCFIPFYEAWLIRDPKFWVYKQTYWTKPFSRTPLLWNYHFYNLLYPCLLEKLPCPITTSQVPTSLGEYSNYHHFSKGLWHVNHPSVLENGGTPKQSNDWSGWWLTYPSEKYERQLGLLFPIYGKITNFPNHQPEMIDHHFP